MKRNVRTTHLILLVFGIALVVAGGILAIFWPGIFKIILDKELILSPISKSYTQWKSPSVPLYLDVYFWNWTNSEEYLQNENSDEKITLKFTQLGPYRFKEIRDKEEVEFHDHDSIVIYNPISYYYFDTEGSNGTLDDVIVNINIVAIGAAGQSVNMDYKKRKIVSMGLTVYNEHVTINKTARELLFEGYEDEMVLMGREGLIDSFKPEDIPYDRIGWFYTRNASTENTGIYSIFTGKDDISKMGSIESFNDQKNHSFYTGECSKLKGSTGELFPPNLSPDSINLFFGDLCRTIPYDFEEEIEIHGIKGYKFAAGERAIDNGTKYPENLCYNDGNEEIFPSGVMNISACRYSSPTFMSYPHFYRADEYYLEDIEGLTPSKKEHQSYFILEPMTGAPLEVVIRYQANFLLRDYEDISLYQNLPTKFIPAMWFEQRFTMNAEMGEQLKFALQIPSMGQIVGIQIICFGLICVIVSSIIRCIATRRARDNSNDINLAEANGGGRRQVETSSPLLMQGKKISVQKMDSAMN